ncbi:putative tetratricopeptide-like helical domain superfamily, DYW domain-containing protein [Helianthus annuus]|nr:putative tetratricopeptide-like helical domain superfamily, DYW domain-containing protein [Helianthus annuus]KAJ0595886.1 putative tetratricopeptide-like helical domain superfamily, DYW domain-containing protein [Helianthus annuus]KAJ0756545.1 putative tetratricopeptide-like helical domain superfamily, DYW domain-containing protein [Helianthus annuus]
MFNLRRLFFRRPFTTSTAHSNFHENFYSLLTKGHLDEALTLFYTSDISHTHQTYADFFHACARHNCISQGQTLHHHMLKTQKERKLIPNVYVYNHLINMYAKCGCLDHARKVFDEMPERNVVSWTALISGYAQHERCEDGFGVFSVMLGECRPNEFAYASVLSSCDRKFGRQVHSHALKTCFGFQTRGKWQEAIDLFSVMRRDSNISFDRATLLSIVSSLSTVKDHDNGNYAINRCLKYCSQVHCLALKTWLISEIGVITALAKAYADLGAQISDLYNLFLETKGMRDIVSWTAFITIFAERDPVKSLLMFSNLCQEGSIPDRHTYSIVLKACSNLVTDKHTMAVHSHILKYGFEHDTVLANALIHAYGRSGSVLESRKVFDFTLVKDIVSWNSMIKIYGLHGQPKNALKCFDQMDVPPDSTTFVALLSACSHAGMVEKGTELFKLMSKTYGIAPQLDHYACMVDILGRSGGILQAQKLINEMPMEPDSVIWSAMLGACRKHGETTLAELASKKLQELDPNSSLAYVQMSNIMCSNGTFNEAVDLRTQMNLLGVKKDPGLSWTEIGNVVHEFAAGGLHHPERMTVRHDLEELVKELRGLGYVPEINLVMRDLEEEDKNRELSYHSEKLAFVFALKRDEFKCFGRAIRIVKNIRICVDCHNFMKFASELTGREIIVRDSNRFHHFKQKVCSCNDYW